MPVPEDIKAALDRLKIKSFEDYLAHRTGWTLRRMARELKVKEQRFIVYHSTWINEQYSAGEVAPLRLGD